MATRVLLFLATAFWLTMSALLWRAEFGGQGEVSSTVPAGQVWQRVLASPDYYRLEVRHHRQSIGHVRWFTSLIEDTNTAPAARKDEFTPEGRVRHASEYNIDLDGIVSVGERRRSARFDLRASFASNRDWREFSGKLNYLSNVWELRASLPAQNLTFRAREAGEEDWERTLTFEELRHPENLLREIAGPWAVGLLGMVPRGAGGQPDPSLGLKWEARTDWLKFGQSRLRVYRLEARLLDRYKAVAFISRAGEILRVELPDELVLVNEGDSLLLAP